MTRVAVTSDRFAAVAPAYADAGLEPVAVPCVRVVAASPGLLDRARGAASAADLLILTSARTLEFLWPEGAMPSLAVAAVAPSTARVASERGGRVVAIGRAGLNDLVEMLAPDLGAAGAVVFPHAAGTDPRALQRLRGLAPRLQEFEVYRSVPIPPTRDVVAAAAFASPSAVDGWHLARDLDELVVGAIGATTGAAVARHRPPDVVASEPSHAALARALASYLEVRR